MPVPFRAQLRMPPAQVHDARIRVEEPRHRRALKFQWRNWCDRRIRRFAKVLHISQRATGSLKPSLRITHRIPPAHGARHPAAGDAHAHPLGERHVRTPRLLSGDARRLIAQFDRQRAHASQTATPSHPRQVRAQPGSVSSLEGRAACRGHAALRGCAAHMARNEPGRRIAAGRRGLSLLPARGSHPCKPRGRAASARTWTFRPYGIPRWHIPEFPMRRIQGFPMRRFRRFPRYPGRASSAQSPGCTTSREQPERRCARQWVPKAPLWESGGHGRRGPRKRK
jgi:hypothetical protein